MHVDLPYVLGAALILQPTFQNMSKRPAKSRRPQNQRERTPATSQSTQSLTLSTPQGLMTAGAIVAVAVVILLWLLSTPTDDAELEGLDTSATTGTSGDSGKSSVDASSPTEPTPFFLPTTPIAFDTATEQKQLLEVVEKTMSNQPNNETAMYIAAITYAELLQTDKALDYFGRALKINPNSTEVLNGQAKVLQQLGKYEETVALLEPHDRPGAPAALLFQLANAHAELGHVEQASKLFQRIVTLGPKNATYRLKLATALSQQEDFVGAEREAREAMTLEPTNRAAHEALATALDRQSKRDEANEIRAAAPKIAEQEMPDDLKHQASFRSFASSTYGMVASIHTRLGDYPQAERLLRHALELDPAMSKNEMLLVEVFRKTGRIQDAIALLQHLLVVQPDNLVNAHNLASLAVQENKLVLAEQALTHLADHDPTGEGHAVLAQFLLRAGKSRQALEHAKIASERSPTVDSYLVLISAYRAMGDEENAQQTLKKARLIAPGDKRL